MPTGTRFDIMEALLKQEVSSQGLAKMLGVSPAAVRQHLTTLEALGLVNRRKVVTQPSRPTYLYRVSPHGMRIFPKRYDMLVAQLIEVLTEREGAAAAGEIVQAAARRLAERARDRIQGAKGEERWEQLVRWLEADFAWHAQVKTERDGTRRLTVHQCPFQDLSKTQPDVCGLFFSALIKSVCGDVPVEHTEAGTTPACCAFLVALSPP
jgi:DeoR family transcriptional regulator, suf operon transcriptional repressor